MGMGMVQASQAELERIIGANDVAVADRIDALLTLSGIIRQNEVLRSLQYDLEAKELAESIADNARSAFALRQLSDDYMLIPKSLLVAW